MNPQSKVKNLGEARGWRPARRLTVRLPRRPRRSRVPTPEELQRRQPCSRGAHYSPGQEAIQKPPRAPEARGEAVSSHSCRCARQQVGLCRACADRGSGAEIAQSRARVRDTHAHLEPPPRGLRVQVLLRPLLTIRDRRACVLPWTSHGWVESVMA